MARQSMLEDLEDHVGRRRRRARPQAEAELPDGGASPTRLPECGEVRDDFGHEVHRADRPAVLGEVNHDPPRADLQAPQAELHGRRLPRQRARRSPPDSGPRSRSSPRPR